MIQKTILLTNIEDANVYETLLKSKKYTVISKKVVLEMCEYAEDIDLEFNSSKSFIFFQKFERYVAKIFQSKNHIKIVYKVENWNLDIFDLVYSQIAKNKNFSYNLVLATFRDSEHLIYDYLANCNMAFDVCLINK